MDRGATRNVWPHEKISIVAPPPLNTLYGHLSVRALEIVPTSPLTAPLAIGQAG